MWLSILWQCWVEILLLKCQWHNGFFGKDYKFLQAKVDESFHTQNYKVIDNWYQNMAGWRSLKSKIICF